MWSVAGVRLALWRLRVTPMHPEVRLHLTGESQHALFIMGRAVAAMRSAGLAEHDRQAFLSEATAGGYDDLLSTVRRWFTIT
jgi:hypothetical protein